MENSYSFSNYDKWKTVFLSGSYCLQGSLIQPSGIALEIKLRLERFSLKKKTAYVQYFQKNSFHSNFLYEYNDAAMSKDGGKAIQSRYSSPCKL